MPVHTHLVNIYFQQLLDRLLTLFYRLLLDLLLFKGGVLERVNF